MFFLQNLRQRSEGCDPFLDYDAVLSRLRCTSYLTPHPDMVDSKLLSCSFAKKQGCGHILAATCENGAIIILNTEPPWYYTINAAHGNALFSATWSEIDMKLITTSGDHAVGLWNVHGNGILTEINSFKAHRSSVKTACFRPRNSDIFATGGRDGHIYVWDSRSTNHNPEQCIMNCHLNVYNKHENARVTWITFQDDLKLISCADADTNINVWDLRKTYLRTTEKPIPIYQLPSPKKNSFKGYSYMVINKNATKLYASSFNSVVYTFNISTYSPTPNNCYFGHAVTCCYDKISLSPDERYLASTDNCNSKVYLWRIGISGEPMIMLEGQLEGLSDVSWCPENELKIATSSDHPSPWIWTVPTINAENQHEKHSCSSLQPVSQSDYEQIGYAKLLKVPQSKKCRRLPAAAEIAFKNTMKLQEKSSMILLPNAAVDGYQTHICVAVQKHRDSTSNWLSNIHNQKMKKADVDKQIKKGVKRKKSSSMSPCNSLTKYFKDRKSVV